MPTLTLYDRYTDQYVEHTFTQGEFYDERYDIWSTLAPDPADPKSLLGGATYNSRFDAVEPLVPPDTLGPVITNTTDADPVSESPAFIQAHVQDDSAIARVWVTTSADPNSSPQYDLDSGVIV